MICPKCHGSSVNVVKRHTNVVPSWVECRPCDYPGCHAGHVDCCDGLQANHEAEVKA